MSDSFSDTSSDSDDDDAVTTTADKAVLGLTAWSAIFETHTMNSAVENVKITMEIGAFGLQQNVAGTAHMKNNPVVGTDVVIKHGASHNTNVKHECITGMKDNENKSCKELVEDYKAGRKGSTTGVFGVFQQTTLNKPLFGGSRAFSLQQNVAGTAHMKYNPVVGTDVVIKHGATHDINVKHECITVMKEYENKSLEELRLEDYKAGRKGSTTGVFGVFQQTTHNKPLFGGSRAFGLQQNVAGTAHMKYNPVVGTDVGNKHGASQSTNVKHEFITGMKEYENKSCKELLEDYKAGRKGSTSVFGSFQQTTHNKPLFGGSRAFGLQQNVAGTAHMKNNPVVGTDVGNKHGASQSTNVKHECITGMKEYENKSCKELLEDYKAGRKGSTSVFGGFQQTTHNKPLFGGSRAFSLQQNVAGTAHVKYNPVVGTDVVIKHGSTHNINVKHECITVMKEYENKSLEELRLEDYKAGRKGSTTGVFGVFQQTTHNKPLFGGSRAFDLQQNVAGTAHMKYNPVVGTDVGIKHGASQSTNVKHECITGMKEYKNKSCKELLEDYKAGRKGSTSVFGGFQQTTHNKPLFGGSRAFSLQQNVAGTAHMKYNPVVGTDVVIKHGATHNINVKHECITVMKEYENKSLEELRLEDYKAGRKGSTTGIFGVFQQTTHNKPLFGGSSRGSNKCGRTCEKVVLVPKPTPKEPTTLEEFSKRFGLLATGSGFPKPLFGSLHTDASITAPPGISALNPFTTSTVTTPSKTSTAAALESISFAQLEEDIKKWSLDLGDQEEIFIKEAAQINDIDRLLITNGVMIAEVNGVVQKVKNEQEQLEQGIDMLLAQQKKLDELPDFSKMFEQVLIENRWCGVVNTERQSMYDDAKNLEKKVQKMSEDLKEVIQHFSETNTDQDSNDPICQTDRLLNDHMASMQWIDDTVSQISTKVDLVKTTIDSYPGKFETG